MGLINIWLLQANSDRAYLITTDDGHEEIVLAARVVKGLIAFNRPTMIRNANIDLVFVKALVIATCTVEAVKNGVEMKNEFRDFIHGKKKDK